MSRGSPDAFAALPDPAAAGGIDDLVERLRMLKVWAGDPSYETIKERVNAAWTAAGRPAAELTIRSTVANCFQPGRRRLNTDLVVAVVAALHPDTGYVAQWRQAMRVIAGEVEAVSQVRVQDTLPQDPPGFTGRAGELEQLRRAALATVEGMPGVGKTQLAVHAGHLLLRDGVVDRVLFVNLRGFHPDPTQPPADPAAVLDGFLRLLGVPGHQIPYELTARTAALRERLAGTRTLVLLDNAASADQVRPLLAGCRTLVTSRRSLPVDGATRLTLDVFTPDEAVTFLAGEDPDAAARIARRCGHLPLALSLIAGHIRNTPGWTLADHADRLDERHRRQRLDTGVEVALDLSYRHLPAGERRLLRLAALHPGQDFDAYAAAALTGSDLDTARSWLDHLCADHLLQRTAPGRYTCHDLVRAHAAGRAQDEDPPAARRDALTRLLDHYLATAAAAMDTLHPAETDHRPKVSPPGTPAPDLTGREAALAWLDTERPTLVAVAGQHTHTVRLAGVLSRYLKGGHYTDALIVHGHALRAARDSGDTAGEAQALNDLGVAHLRQGRPEPAADYLRQALDRFRRAGDPAGQAHTLFDLGNVAERSGRYPEAVDYKQQALAMYRLAGDRTGEAMALSGLGVVLERAGRLPEAGDHYQRALTLARATGNRRGEAFALHGLGELDVRADRYGPAGDHLRQAILLHRELGNRTAEAGALESLGLLHTRLGELDRATGYYRQALAFFRETGNQDNEAWVLNGLGETAQAAGRAADALTHHTAARALAGETGNRHQQARAHAGIGQARSALGDPAAARDHYERAVALYTELGLSEAGEIRDRLKELT